MKLVRLLTLIVFLSVTHLGVAQMSQFHLGPDIIQNHSFNPTYFPEGKWFIGIPAISGINVQLNSRLSFADLVERNENGDRILVYDDILSKLKRNNLEQVSLKVSDFYVGFKQRQGAVVLFSNERLELDFMVPKQAINIILNGTDQFIGSTVELKNIGLKARYFRETGIGYTFFSKNGRYRLGYRAKVLNGFYSGSTQNSFLARLTTSPLDLNVSFVLRDAVFNQGGDFDNFGIGYLLTNKNRGLGLDLGGSYRLTKELELSLAVNDIGYINWQDNPKNYAIADANFTYGGIPTGSFDDVLESLEDSLGRQFQRITTEENFREWLPAVVNLSGRYQLNNRDEIYGTVSSRFIMDRAQMTYAAGFKRRFWKYLAVNATLSKAPQQFVNLGVGAVADVGALQIFVAADKPYVFNFKQMRYTNLGFGMNLIFGRGAPKQDAPKRFRFLGGNHVKVKSREDIYLNIKKQNRFRAIFNPKKNNESKLRKVKGNEIGIGL